MHLKWLTTKANDSRRPYSSVNATRIHIPGSHKSKLTSGSSFRWFVSRFQFHLLARLK